MTDRAAAETDALLRSKGLRATGCRRAVLALLADAQEPMSVEQIAAALGRARHGRQALGGRRFDLSTIYRSVEAFERCGLVNRLELGDDVRRYCRCDGHHHHIRCLKCGRIDKVELCLIERMAGQIERSMGYRIVDHHLVFSGLCRACRR
jgi:Fe2+ or Zn2+ uptake regulation protein